MARREDAPACRHPRAALLGLRSAPARSFGHVRAALLALLVAAGPACATIVTGTHQRVEVTARPEHALVSVDGGPAQPAPVELLLSKRSAHVLRVSAPGHRDRKVELRREVQWIVLGNVFAGILPGLMVDFLSGGAFELPRRVDVALEREGAGR